MRIRQFIIVIASALVLVIVTAACDGLSSDCSNFCERVHECVDSNLNVDGCEKACTNWADGDDDRESKVESCSECLSDNDACSEASRRCTADCTGIPVQREGEG